MITFDIQNLNNCVTYLLDLSDAFLENDYEETAFSGYNNMFVVRLTSLNCEA